MKLNNNYLRRYLLPARSVKFI